MRNWFLIVFLAVVGFYLGSCSGGGTKKPQQALTSGHVKISIDESLRSVMEQQMKVFDSSFPDAKVEESYKTEYDCFQDFFNDSAQLIITTRDLTTEEKGILKKQKIFFRSLDIARGGIALIVNPASEDTIMTVEQLKYILTNRYKRQYDIVFDNQRSGTVRYLLDSLIPGEQLPSNIYAANSNEAVLDYVAKNKNALGVLGALNIYANDLDTGIGHFNPDIRVVALRNDSTYEFYQPYQAYLALKLYPLTRTIYFISKDSRHGVATGFANFIASQRGQLIFKHSKLSPTRVPLYVREVQLH